MATEESSSSVSSETGDLLTNATSNRAAAAAAPPTSAITPMPSNPPPPPPLTTTVDLVAAQIANVLQLGAGQRTASRGTGSRLSTTTTRATMMRTAGYGHGYSPSDHTTPDNLNPGPQYLAYSSSILLSLRPPSYFDADSIQDHSLLHWHLKKHYAFDVPAEYEHRGRQEGRDRDASRDVTNTDTTFEDDDDDQDDDGDDERLQQPHIYELALKAYFYLRRTGQDQALVLHSATATYLTGQGEMRRLATRALLSVGSNTNDPNSRSTRISRQIQAAEFIIDAFGCTGGPNLSSSSSDHPSANPTSRSVPTIAGSTFPRFGRYSELQYNDRGRIMGYKTLLYGLDLDTYRLGFSLYGNHGVQNREKSFDVLRWLVGGATEEERNHLNLPNLHGHPSHHSAAASTSGPGGDGERFGLLKQAFKTFGFPKKAVASLCSTLAAILHISSLEFHSPTGNDPSEPCTIANPEVLHTIANLLGLLDNPASAQTNLSKLTEALTFKTAYIDNEKCTVVLDLEKALEYKEVVAKSLYRLVWEWLGEFVNQKLSKEDFAGFIALVDFPSLSNAPGHRNEGNTLSTLCLNLASERLSGFIANSLYPQQNHDIQVEEGIPASLIPRPMQLDSTNSETIRILTNMPGGLVHIVDDQTLRKGKSERTCLDAMGKRWGKHKNFGWRKESDPSSGRAGTFTIEHWNDSELVTYSTENFLEKNLNLVPSDLVELLGGKAVPTVQSLSSGNKRSSKRRGSMGGNKDASSATSIIGGSSNPFVRELFANEVVAAAQSEKATMSGIAALDDVDEDDAKSTNSNGLSVPGMRALRKPSMKRKPSSARVRPPLPGTTEQRTSPADPGYGSGGLTRKKSVAVRRAEVLSKHCLLGSFNTSLNDLFETLSESCRLFFVLCMSPTSTPTPSGLTGPPDMRFLKSQIKALQLPSIRDRCASAPTWVMEFEFKDFWNRYSLIDRWQEELISKTASMMWRDKLECVREEMEWNPHEFAIGKTKVFLNHTAFRQIEDHLRVVDQDEQKRKKEFLARPKTPEPDPYSPFSRPARVLEGASSPAPEEIVSPFGVSQKPYNHPMYAGSVSTAALPLVQADPFSNPRGMDDEDDRKTFLTDDEFNQSRLDLEGGGGTRTPAAFSTYAPSKNMFNEAGGTEKGLPLLDEKEGPENAKETVEVYKETSARKQWKFLVWCFTWWIPSFMLTSVGRMKRPDVRMAWREKVTIFMLITLLCGATVFVIVFLGNIICPKEYVYTPAELSDYSYANNAGHELVSIRGEVFDLGSFANVHYPSVVPTRNVQKYGGLDATNLFPVQVSALCNGKSGSVSPWVTLDTSNATDQNAVYHDFRAFTNDSRPDWYWEQMVFLRYNYRKGFVGYSTGTVSKRAKATSTRNTVIYKGNVYDMSGYIANNGGGVQAPPGFQVPSDTDRQFMHDSVVTLFQQYAGQDITSKLDNLNIDAQILAAQKVCLRNLFFIGKVDSRNSVQCQFSRYILLAFSIIMVCIIGFKFIAALSFGRARQPEDHDRFVILQVPCYTEGEDSLRECIESLASLKYDDKRKLLFVICDGMIIGSGNDRPTPRIVLDILGADPALDPEPLSFQSLGEGAKQHNMGKVYSGLYEHAGHVIPYIVMVKVGKPSERSRPGNRGKRDSQMIMMRFMNRVHFDSPMSPCELEIYHQIKNVIGVNPTFYEFLLAIDADTVVDPLSLNRFISAMVHDRKVLATCGETELANAKKSMISMIQVYEYFISHHLAKAFESLFGSVTCLPGCFSLYRLRSVENKPLFIANDVVNAFGENRVDTLHMKNLLHLGEDRYLTTLLLKNFPTYKLTFTKDAHAKTIAPEDWKVLLSQRRRWINSTIHNLAELIGRVDRLCGFCCFSMRAVVLVDLLSTLIQPVTVAYIVYLIYLVAAEGKAVPITALIMLAAIYGLQALIFLFHRKFEMIVWMIIYILAIPIFSFLLPLYSFWRQDDFSWGQTRVVLGEKGKKLVIHDEGKFDEREIPLKSWHEYENELWERGSNASIGQLLAEKEEAEAAALAEGGQPFASRAHKGAEGSIYGHESVMGFPAGAGLSGSRPRTPMSELGGARSYHQALNSYGGSGALPGYVTPGGGAAGPYAQSRVGSIVGISPHHHQSGSYGSQQQLGLGQGYEMQPGVSSSSGETNPFLSSYQHSRHPSFGSMGGRSVTMPSSTSQPLMPGQEVSDEQLEYDVKHILARADLQTLTKKGVREELEQMYGIELSSRKAFINAQIEQALSSLY